MNDLFDVEVGADTDSYPRALYAPHPVLSGMISRGRLARAALFVNVVDLGILVVLAWYRGWPVVGFAVAGFALSVAYTAPPLRLKKRGLGEPDVFVVWGPLMVCGTYYAAVGHLPWEIVAASVPYGLLCTAVLMGKHIDKAPFDEPLGIRTLPVVLGERRARAATVAMMVAFYVAVVTCVAVRALPWPALLSLGARPQVRPGDRRRSASPSPPSRPSASRFGPCGSRRWPSSTPAGRDRCSCSAWSSPPSPTSTEHPRPDGRGFRHGVRCAGCGRTPPCRRGTPPHRRPCPRRCRRTTAGRTPGRRRRPRPPSWPAPPLRPGWLRSSP